MKRNLQWGLLALGPHVLTIYFSIMIQQDTNYVPFYAEGNLFLTDYWWAITVGLFFIPISIFYIHVIRNKEIMLKFKALWIIGFLFTSALLVPVYWWVYAEEKNA